MSETETLLEGGEGGAAPEISEIEAKARRLGWVPKDEFKGDPAKHRSAEEFLERGEHILPILKRDNDKLHTTISRMEKEQRELRETFDQFVKFSSKAEERAYKRAKADLEAKLDNAIQSADVDTARQARKELADLEAEKQEPKPERNPEPEAPQVDPEITQWTKQNAWFDKDPALRGYAIKVYGQMEAKGDMSVSDMLAETKKKVMERFPEDFGINPRREGAAAVAQPSGEMRRRGNGRTYDDLPADAKKACDKFVKTIPGYTRDQYLKDYGWD